MKKLILTGLIALGSVLTINAQIWNGSTTVDGNIWRNGNIGIGTAFPTNALTVQKVSGGTGFSGTNGTGGVRVNWSTGYGVALDAWDSSIPRWGITKFSGNTPTVILEGLSNSNDVYFNSGGKVGIGTTAPTNALTVQKVSGGTGFSGTNGTGGVRVNWSTGYGVALDAWDDSIPRWGITKFSGNTPTVILEGLSNSNDVYFNSGGKVGIGTTAPTNALTVQKVSGGTGFSGTNGTGGVRVNWSTGYGVALDAWDVDVPRWGITKFSGNTPTVILEGKSNSNDVYFNSGGYVGIGTISPKYKLDVCGTIRAQEVKVDLLGGCDFVFKKDYKLMNLNELEKFVTTKQHLPEIASEKEMIENGLNMKEFQMKLLQKVEELTLYVIEQNKQINKQNNQIKKQNVEIRKLKAIKKKN